MDDLFAARSQMAMSLAFHIVFAAIGIAMPLLMVIAEGMWLRTRDEVYLALAKRWSKGTAVLFAVGAVSGTVLSFELGLLWPGFMEFAGPIIGMPFSLEGFAFFLEAIFLGIYLYGWKRVPPLMHWASGWMVMISGILSGIFVICANGWMNTPTGFTLGPDGEILSIDPLVAMFNPAALPEGFHMTAAAFTAVGFLFAAVHALVLRKNPQSSFHRRGFAIALLVGGLSSLLMPVTGHFAAEQVVHNQPAKFAAIEGLFETQTAAPFLIGGWPDEETMTTHYAIEVPMVGSLLAHGDPYAEVTGLEDFDRELWPPVAITHVAYQIMLGCGGLMIFTALIGGVLAIARRGIPDHPLYLPLVIISGPMGMIAIEAGWTVTEVGRQPWVIQGLMKTSDAVTPMPGLVVPFASFSLLYLLLGVVVVVLLRRIILAEADVALESTPQEGSDAI